MYLFYGKKNGDEFYDKKRNEQRDWDRHISHNYYHSNNNCGTNNKGNSWSILVPQSKENSSGPIEKYSVGAEWPDLDVQRFLGLNGAGDEGNKKQYKKYFGWCKSYAGHSWGSWALVSN